MRDVRVCGHSLAVGRSCVHVHGVPHRHSHTWQLGDARYERVNGHLVNMETGEVVGDWPEIDVTGFLSSGNHIRVLELYLPGFAQAIELVREEARMLNAPNGFDWHYRSPTHIYGSDSSGHSVEFDRATGRVTRLYSVNERRQAVDYAQRFGPTKASRKLGVPVNTIKSWAKRGA
jgi:hypothetical protein